jgi:quercetin dioxygenase-like cupin family protein
MMTATLLKRFDQPDEVRTFEKGRFEVVRLGGLTLGRATYEPGWKWSTHVAPIAGTPLCGVEHVGMVLAGRAVAAYEDGTVSELAPGDVFHIPPVPHDSWVVGDEPYVSLHFLGADHYTR